MKIIVTGFEPFDGGAINPSWEAVTALQTPEGTELLKLQLPVVYGKAADILKMTMKKELPETRSDSSPVKFRHDLRSQT